MQQNGRRLAVDVREAPDEPESSADAVVRQATSMARRTRARVRGALRLFDARLAGLLFALVTDAIVTAGIARTLGELPRPRSNHAVVCGLGRVGLRIVQRLVAAGIPCVAVERSEDNPFLDATPRLGVPVLVDDASRRETLTPLRVPDARVVLAVTDDDLANLETALNARQLNPSVRVVMRLFSHDLATRAERTFNIAISRSVSALAAPAFVAAIAPAHRGHGAAGLARAGRRRPARDGAGRPHRGRGRGGTGAARTRARRRLVAAGPNPDRARLATAGVGIA
jgi:hypothetical protein